MAKIIGVMENEQAKQEAIKKAYGKHWEYLQNFINENGEVCKAMCPDKYQNIFGNVFWDNLNGQWWPKSLKGLEDNNGWTRIETDGSNLPFDEGYYKSCKVNVISPNLLDKDTIASRFKLGTCTHYKPIEKELPPVY